MMYHLISKNKTKKAVTVLLVAGLLLTGCGATGQGEGEDSQTTLEKAQQRGYVTVGFAQEKPYAYQTEDGTLTGEAVEVAREVLKELGIKEMRGELTEFGSLIPGLNAKRYDMVTAGMFITPARAKEVLFADPEYSIGEAVAVKAGNPLNLHSYKDIAANKDVRIAVPSGAVEYDYLIQSGVAKEQIISVPNIASALAALPAGRADAFTATGPALQAAIDSSGTKDIVRVGDFEQPVIDGKSVRGYGATAFRKADEDFVRAFNQELAEMKESGRLLEILQEFDFTEDELPGDVTAADLLGQS